MGAASDERMDRRSLEALRGTLIARSKSLLTRRRHTLEDEQQILSEREPDWEDAAAAETMARVLDDLSEQEREKLARIDASLARIADGTYGKCVRCARAIETKRLRAIPESDRCARCADAH